MAVNQNAPASLEEILAQNATMASSTAAVHSDDAPIQSNDATSNALNLV
jgi:hypothetical protein